MKYKLVDKQTGREIQIGELVSTFREGETYRLVGFTPPRHAGSTGRVIVRKGTQVLEYFPSVIGAEIVEHAAEVIEFRGRP